MISVFIQFKLCVLFINETVLETLDTKNSIRIIVTVKSVSIQNVFSLLENPFHKVILEDCHLSNYFK